MNSKIRRNQNVAQSISITKTPPLRPNSKPTAIKEKLPQVRQSQLPNPKPVPPARSERSEKYPTKKSKITPDMDPFEASEILRKEIQEEFGEKEEEKEPELPWLNRLDELNSEITKNLNQSSMIDTSFVNTFCDATRDFECSEDVFESASRMINSGFDAINHRLEAARSLIDQRMDLVQQMMSEIQDHGVSEFTADLKLDDNPFSDSEDEKNSREIINPKMPTGGRNAPARNSQLRGSQMVRKSQFPRNPPKMT